MSANTTLSPTSLLAVLVKVNRPLRLDDLLRLLKVNRGRKKDIRDMLHGLLSEGKVVLLSEGRWVNPPPVRTLLGVLSIQPRTGAGWVSPAPAGSIDPEPESPDELAGEESDELSDELPDDFSDDFADDEPSEFSGELAENESVNKESDAKPTKNRQAFESDIFINDYDLNDAWHGDIVEVVITKPPTRRQPGQKPQGRITRIVRRSTTELAVRAGTSRTPTGLLCQPLDQHYPIRLDVNIDALPSVPEAKELILVRIGDRLGPTLWQGAAVKTLGSERTMAGQERLVRLHLHIPEAFPPAVTHAAGLLETAPVESFPCVDGPLDRHSPDRRDLRHLPLVTIDGEDARDFDDAICVEPLPDGRTILWVAIADVSHYVPGTSTHLSKPIDVEAGKRGTSVYFPRSVTPMLPEILCNNLCSLRPDEDRPVMVARMVFGPAGEPGQTAFYPGLMRSRARLTYEDVQALLDEKPNDLSPDVANMLHHAAELAQKLMRLRASRGGLDLDLPEAAFDFAPDDTPIGMHKRARLFSHRLIEAFMLAANESVATFLLQRHMTFPLRAHPAPNPERVATLCRTLQAMGLPLPNVPRPDRQVPSRTQDRKNSTDQQRPGQNLSTFISAILNSARGKPEAPVINRLTLRTLTQARYAQAPLPPDEMEHFGLASEAYCHFTSPIRRYPDLDVHRVLKNALREKTDLTSRKRSQKDQSFICEGYNTSERRAQEAEREINRRLSCLVLEPRVGEVFTALIVSVNHFGLFVEPEILPVEGLVRVESLPDDWYEFDEDSLQLLGQARGLRFQLGQTVQVRLTEVNLERLEINFVLDGVEPTRARSPRLDRRPAPRSDGNGERPRSPGRPPSRTPARRGSKDEGRSPDKPASRPKPKKSGTRKAERATGGAGTTTGKGHRGR